MNPDFLNTLRTCTKCDLREIVCKAYSKKDSFNTFGFYYNESDIPAAKIVLIMQNPGLPGNLKKTAEFKEYKKATIENFVSINQKYMFPWLTDKNNPFFKPFINLLHLFNLIDYNYQSLIAHSNPHQLFFRDFLVTDLVKCRTTTGNITDYTKDCFDNYPKNDELPKIAPG